VSEHGWVSVLLGAVECNSDPGASSHPLVGGRYTLILVKTMMNASWIDAEWILGFKSRNKLHVQVNNYHLNMTKHKSCFIIKVITTVYFL
jgi:hypothetical protein